MIAETAAAGRSPLRPASPAGEAEASARGGEPEFDGQFAALRMLRAQPTPRAGEASFLAPRGPACRPDPPEAGTTPGGLSPHERVADRRARPRGRTSHGRRRRLRLYGRARARRAPWAASTFGARRPARGRPTLLRAENTVSAVHAIVLSGGSAYGLASASGVMRLLEERGVGHRVGAHIVPIVPAAIIFDLRRGRRLRAAGAGRRLRRREQGLDGRGRAGQRRRGHGGHGGEGAGPREGR